MYLLRSFLFIGAVFLLSHCSRSDKDIEADVSVNVHPTAPEITVNVTDGIVKLSGMVNDSASWRATIKAAESTPGVKSVDAKLHVANPRPAN